MPLPIIIGSMFNIISSIKFSFAKAVFKDEPPISKTFSNPLILSFDSASCGEVASV